MRKEDVCRTRDVASIVEIASPAHSVTPEQLHRSWNCATTEHNWFRWHISTPPPRHQHHHVAADTTTSPSLPRHHPHRPPMSPHCSHLHHCHLQAVTICIYLNLNDFFFSSRKVPACQLFNFLWFHLSHPFRFFYPSSLFRSYHFFFLCPSFYWYPFIYNLSISISIPIYIPFRDIFYFYIGFEMTCLPSCFTFSQPLFLPRFGAIGGIWPHEWHPGKSEPVSMK